MKIVIQRSKESKVLVKNKVVGSIEKGLVLLICCEKGDSKENAKKAVEKILKLRIFQDEQGKMNKDIIQVGGEILAVSQFTLSWNGQKGNRPSFDSSMAPDSAFDLFNYMCGLFEKSCLVSTGEFGASMDVQIQNDGPVTFSLDF